MGTGKLLEVFYDYNCPWCYLGTANTDRLRRERDIAIRWTLFPLHPEVPVEGMELAELFQGCTGQLKESKGRLKEAAAVDEDWLRAKEMGVTVVPFYLYGEEALVGFRPYEDFLKLVDGK